MKKIIILLTLLIVVVQTFAQTKTFYAPCGTIIDDNPIQFSRQSLNATSFIVNQIKYVFNVKVHYIANNVPVAEQETKALDMVGVLNLNFNPAEIYFKYSGFDNINNTSYLNIDLTTFQSFYTANTSFIDIYVTDMVENNPLVWGTTFAVSTNFGMKRKAIAIRKDKIPNYANIAPNNLELGSNTLAHEVGHYLGLEHTHQRWEIIPNATNPSAPLYIARADGDVNSNCVIKDENLNNSEATIKGDFIADTAPDRPWQKYKVSDSNLITQYNSANCVIAQSNWQLGPMEGCAANTINFNPSNGAVFNPPINNIMAYYQLCSQSFTQGQYDRMRAFINTNLNTTNQFLIVKQNTVASLYQPFYKSPGTQPNSPTTAYMRTITPNTANTGVNVWSCPRFYLRYQKGFNTFFTTNTGLVYKTGNIQFNHVNSNGQLALLIPAIDPLNTVGTEGIVWDCFASFEPYVKGSIKTTPLLGSTILTEKILTESEASDPQLSSTLEPATYNIIIKKTESGYENQKVIFKNP